MSLAMTTDQLAERVHGMTLTEAHKRRVCVNCKQTIRPGNSSVSRPGVIYSSAGLNEYRISALCEYCFDEITKAEENEECFIEHDDLPF